MKTINFSEDYEKLPLHWEGTRAILVGSVHAPDMWAFKKKYPEIIRRDSKFRLKEGNYPLDFKDGIILSFIHIQTGLPFPTIRRYTPEKWNYYCSSLLQQFTLQRTHGK